MSDSETMLEQCQQMEISGETIATETPDERAAALHCLRIATSLTLTPQCL